MNHLHFTINLNKHGELKQLEVAEQRTFVRFVVFFAFCTILLSIFVWYLHSDLTEKRQNRQALLQKIRDEVRTYQTSGDYLSAKDLERLAVTSTNRVFWSRKLVALSTDISDKIAVTRFTYKNGIFSLYGITRVEENEREFDLIDELIATLRNNPDIYQDFPEIKFVSSNRDREKEADIIRFQIDCISRDVGGTRR